MNVTTGSRTTRMLGVACLVGVATLLLFGFVLTEADLVQQDVVRMIYVHVPSAIAGYTGFAGAKGRVVLTHFLIVNKDNSLSPLCMGDIYGRGAPPLPKGVSSLGVPRH